MLSSASDFSVIASSAMISANTTGYARLFALTTYYFKVKIATETDNSYTLPAISTQTLAPVGMAVNDLTALTGSYIGSIILQWTWPESLISGSSYYVQYSTGANEPWTYSNAQITQSTPVAIAGNAQAHIIGGLDIGRNSVGGNTSPAYYFRVWVATGGPAGFSTQSNGSTNTAAIPGAFSTNFTNHGANNGWMSTINGAASGDDAGNSVAVDVAGNVHIVGSYNAGGTNDDFILRKYDSAGNITWEKYFNSAANNVNDGSGVATDASGNVYVIGREARNDLGQSYNIWLAKYGATGMLLWSKTFNGGSNGSDQGKSIAVDGSGNIYAAGLETVTGQNTNAWIAKYDTNGLVQWTTNYNGSASGGDGATGIVVDGSGNAYVTGYEVGTGAENLWVRKYDTNGLVQWTTSYNGASDQNYRGYSIARDIQGNLVVAGYETIAGQSQDIVVRKFDPSGLTLWSTSYNDAANGTQMGFGVSVDTADNVYVTGSDGVSGQGNNLWLRKFTKDGLMLWTTTYNNAGNTDDSGNGIFVAGSAIYVTGSENRTDLGQGQNILLRKFIQNVPNAPSNISAVSRTTTTIVWSWTDNAGGYQYQEERTSVTRAMDGVLIASVSVDVSQYTQTGLSANSSSQIYLTVFNVAGASQSANSTVVYTSANAPVNSALVNVGISSIAVSWNTNSNPSYTDYEVQYTTSSNFSTYTSSIINNLAFGSATISGLPDGTSHHIRVRSLNENALASPYDAPLTTSTRYAPGTRVWSAGSSGNASVAGNWTPQQVPVTGDNIFFNGTSGQTCFWNLADITVGSFTINSGFTGIISLSTHVRLSGDLTRNAGHLLDFQPFIFVGTSTQKVGGVNGSFNSLEIQSSSDVMAVSSLTLHTYNQTSGLFRAGNFAHAMTGNWNQTGGAFLAETSSITFYGGQDVTAVSGNGFNNFIVDAGTTPANILTVNALSGLSFNNFTLVSGTFVPNGMIHVVSGTWSQTGGAFNSTSTAQISIGGNFSQTGGSFLTVSTFVFNGGVQTVSISSSSRFGHLVSSVSTSLTAASDIAITSLTISRGNYTHGSYRTKLGGALAVQGGTFDRANGIWEFSGTSSQTVPSNSDWGTVAVSNQAGMVFSGNSTVVNLSIEALGVFVGQNQQTTVTGNWSSSGTYSNAVSTVIFSGGNAQSLWTVPGSTFNHVTVNKSASATLQLLSNMQMAGDLVVSGANFNLGQSTLTISGSIIDGAGNLLAGAGSTVLFTDSANSQMNQNGSSTLNKLSVVNSTLTLTNSLTINSDVKLLQGVLNLGANTHYLAGGISVNAGGIIGNSLHTLELNGSALQIASFTAGTTFNQFNINSSSKVLMLGTSFSVSTLTAVAGAFELGGGTLTVSSMSVQSAATFVAYTGTLRGPAVIAGSMSVTGLIYDGNSTSGLQIVPGAVIGNFSTVTFRNTPASIPAVRFGIASGTYTFSGHVFDASVSSSNVDASAFTGLGYIAMLNASGPRSGPSYETDPYNRVYWSASTMPANFAVSVNTTSVTYTWTDVLDESGYRIRRASDSSVIADLGANTVAFQVTGLSSNSYTNNYLESYNPVGSSVTAAIVKYTLPAEPLNVSTSNITTTSIDLSWSGNGNTSTTTYEVNFATNAAFVSTSTFYAVTVSSTFANLSSNTTYYFRVRTVNGDGIFTGFANTIYARTLPTPKYWTKAGGAGNASDGNNWDPTGVPQDGDVIIFSSSGTANCTWDLTSPLESLSINTGYSGTITLGNALTVGDFTLTAGGINLNGNNLTVRKSHIRNGGTFTAGAGTTVEFGGSTAQTISGSANPIQFGSAHFVVNNSSSVTLQQALYFGGNMQISAGTLYAGAYEHRILGNWTHTAGSFVSQGSTIAFEGTTAQTVNELNSFSHFKVNSSSSVAITSAPVLGTFTLAQGTVTLNNGDFAIPGSFVSTSAFSRIEGAGGYRVIYGSGSWNISGITLNAVRLRLDSGSSIGALDSIAFTGQESGQPSIAFNYSNVGNITLNNNKFDNTVSTNVSASAVTVGTITMATASGDRFGVSYEFDPNNVVKWPSAPATKLQVILPGEFAVQGSTMGKSGSPSTQTALTAFTVTVRAVNPDFYLDTSSNPTVNIVTSDGGDSEPANAALVSGSTTFFINFSTGGTFTITASTVSGPGLVSGVSANVPTNAPPPPSGPTSFTATALSSSAIKWDWVDNASNEQGYRLVASTGGTVVNLGINTTTYIKSGLMPNTSFAAYAEAFNSGGSSVSATVTSYTLANAPSGSFVSAVTSFSVTAQWSLNNNTANTLFEAQISTDSGFAVLTASNSAAVTTYAFTGLSGSTSYYIQVRAKNGNSIYSGYDTSVTTQTNPAPPSAPTGVTGLVISTSSIKWLWSDVATTESGYRVLQTTSSLSISGNLAADTTYYLQNALASNTSYSIYVEAYNVVGSSFSQNAVRYTLAEAPSNLSFVTVSSFSANLSWTATANTQYRIDRSPDGSSWTGLSTSAPSASSYSDTSVAPETTYYYRLAAINGETVITGYFSNVLSTVTLPGPPAMPAGFTATAQGISSITWTWSDVTSETSYRLRFSSDTTLAANLSANVTVYTQSSLGKNTSQSLYLEAVNVNGTSATASVSRFTFADVPGALSFSNVYQSSFTLNWTQAANPAGTVYQAQISSDSAFGVYGASSTALTSFSTVSLTNENTYYARVRALNGESVYSNYASVISTFIADAQPPDSVTYLTAENTGYPGELRVKWIIPSEDAGTSALPTYFDLRRATNSFIDAQFNLQTSSTVAPIGSVGQLQTLTLTGLTDDVTYYFKIRAVDNMNNLGGISASTSAFPGDKTAPDAITEFTGAATGFSGEVKLTWTVPKEYGVNSVPSSYDIRYATGSFNDTTFASRQGVTIATSGQNVGMSITYTVTGLTANVLYYFHIKSADPAGNASAIDAAPAVVVTVSGDTFGPETITNLTAAATGLDNEIKLTWTIPRSSASSTAAPAAFDLRWDTVDFGTSTFYSVANYRYLIPTGAPGQTQTITIGGLTNNSTYYFHIRSSNTVSGGLTGLTDSGSAYYDYPGDRFAPTAVSDLAVSNTGRREL